MSDNNSIGVGIIGCGQRGAVCLGVCLAQTYPETDFVIKAMCDRNPDRMTHAIGELRRHYGEHGVELLPQCYLDYKDLIADPNVDMVMVTSPQYLHREHALAAMAAGKKVYLDKPIAHTAEDAVAIAEGRRPRATRSSWASRVATKRCGSRRSNCCKTAPSAIWR